MSLSVAGSQVPAPLGLLAELTHRCPLACPYCSNPLELEDRAAELDAATWARVFREAAAMGVLQVHLSGGEPASRRDLVEIVASAREAGLYTNLITSAIGLDLPRLARLKQVGLDHVQLSLQDVQADSADHIAGYSGAHARKLAFAKSVVELGLALTVNTVIHRANIGRIAALVEMAASLGAGRVEIAHAQYYGWALRNRQALMPTRDQVGRAMQEVANNSSAVSGTHRDRSGRARLLRTPAEGLHGRLGAPLAERHALRSGAAMPRRRDHSRPAVLVGSRPAAGGDLEPFSGIPGISRNRLDARAVPVLRDARNRPWRVPLPGDGDRGRRGGDGPGVRTVSASRSDAVACRPGFFCRKHCLRVSRAHPTRQCYCHSSSLNAAVALRAL